MPKPSRTRTPGSSWLQACIILCVGLIFGQAGADGHLSVGAARADHIGEADRAWKMVESSRAALADLETRFDALDPRFFESGEWVHDGPSCLRCEVGPGTAAAAFYSVSGDERYLELATATFDRAITNHRLGSGAFGPPSDGETGPDIQTSLFAVHLGIAITLLEDHLDHDRRARWLDALTGAVDFLDRNGNFRWYTNGNIALANAAAAGLAWRHSGATRYESLHEAALEFALRPDQGRWPGRGLRTYASADPDTPEFRRGFLTEEGEGGLGYDPDYAQVQADFAAIIALTTEKPAAHELVRLLVNQLVLSAHPKMLRLTTAGGTRISEPRRWTWFNTPAVGLVEDSDPVLGCIAERQRARLGETLSQGPATNIALYQHWGSRFAVWILLEQRQTASGRPATPSGTHLVQCT